MPTPNEINILSGIRNFSSRYSKYVFSRPNPRKQRCRVSIPDRGLGPANRLSGPYRTYSLFVCLACALREQAVPADSAAILSHRAQRDHRGGHLDDAQRDHGGGRLDAVTAVISADWMAPSVIAFVGRGHADEVILLIRPRGVAGDPAQGSSSMAILEQSMPLIDYLVLADYVRQDAGMTHIMGAGLDTIFVPEGVAVAVPVGIVARLTFDSRDQVGAEHEISLVFQRAEDAEDLLKITQRFLRPEPIAGVPEYWRTAVSVAFRINLPIPGHGNYRLQVTLDDNPTLSRSADVRAIAPPNQN